VAESNEHKENTLMGVLSMLERLSGYVCQCVSMSDKMGGKMGQSRVQFHRKEKHRFMLKLFSV